MSFENEHEDFEDELGAILFDQADLELVQDLIERIRVVESEILFHETALVDLRNNLQTLSTELQVVENRLGV